jgi:hypothetical protein
LFCPFRVETSGFVDTDFASQLDNVRVVFLPRNAMSCCQPGAQGIINALKGHYLENVIHWYLGQWEEKIILMREINQLIAI